MTDLIFANALFFNGRWYSEFDPSLTKDSDFHLLDGIKVRVPFMTGRSRKYRLHAYEGFKVLNLPYREGRYEEDILNLQYREGRDEEDSRCFSMQIYLPDKKEGLHEMLQRLASSRGFLNGEGDIRSHEANIKELRIPRFKFAFDFESKALKKLGLELSSETLVHKSCIEVDEVGSKAAASASVIRFGICGPPEKKYDFVADHPFLFLVREDTSRLVLFFGQVMDPSMH